MSHYAHRHSHPQGPGDNRPTALEIVEDEGLTGQLSDKVFLITGISSGIGIETMRALCATGGHVFGTARNMEKGQTVVDEIKAKTAHGGKMTLIEMEMDSLASIKKGVEEILKHTKTLNVIINNAGVMAPPEGKTKDGFETQFGTNHIGHFYLFQLLKPTLLASSSASFPSRVVSLSSYVHRVAPPRPDDYNFTEPGSYHPFVAYGQAKTANIWFSNEVERRYGAKHLHSTSLHPGGIFTGLQAHVPAELMAGWDTPEIRSYMKNAAQGAATSVYAALSKEWRDKGGKYLSDCVEQPAWKHPDDPMAVGDDGFAPWAYDEEGAKRLWRDSLNMVGMEDDDEEKEK